MRLLRFVLGLLAIATVAFVVLLVAARNLDWSAQAKPGRAETKVARFILGRWIRNNSPSESIPFPANEHNLGLGRDDFNEHCATCHGLDGSGRNSFEANFYPPIPKLTGAVQKLSDGEIYFVIAHGIRLSGMPSFSAHHSQDEMWRIALWVRHLANLSPAERTELQSQMVMSRTMHEQTMKKAGPDATRSGDNTK